MPEGAPYPPATSGATEVNGLGSPGPTPALSALQEFSGQGDSAQIQHQSFQLFLLRTRMPHNIRATRFSATAAVFDNQSGSTIYIGVGRKVSTLPGGYDYRVAPGGVLMVHTQPTITWSIMVASGSGTSTHEFPLLGSLEVYLLAGYMASFIPPYSHIQRPGYAIAMTATVTITTTHTTRDEVWSWQGGNGPTWDPFANYPVLLDRVITAGAPLPTFDDTQAIKIPNPQGQPFWVPISFHSPVVDLGGVIAGKGFREKADSVQFAGAPPNGRYQITFIYRLIGPSNAGPNTPNWTHAGGTT